MRYIESLLRFYRPGFEDLSYKERYALVGRALDYTNALLSAQRNLLRFLEYGEPGKDLRAPAENTGRDVEAAVLRDVEGLSSAAIGEVLRIPQSDSDALKGGHSRVAKMASRGREVLTEAWGEEGWEEQARSLKAEAGQASGAATDGESEFQYLLKRLEMDKREAVQTEAARPLKWSAIYPPEEEDEAGPEDPPDPAK